MCVLLSPQFFALRVLFCNFLKVEVVARLEVGSRVCDQRPGEDEHVQNEVHALLFCQDHKVCELRTEETSPFCLHLFQRTFQNPTLFAA